MSVRVESANQPTPAEHIVSQLPSAIVGNGSLLATLTPRGEVQKLFWPHVDHGQHLGQLRLGLVVDEQVHWLDSEPFSHEQAYEEDASIVRTTARAGALTVETVDLVRPDDPVLARGVTMPRGRLVVYCRPELDESMRYGGVYVEPTRGALVFYRRGVALATALRPGGDVACGGTERHGFYSVFEDALDGQLEGHIVAAGAVDGAFASDVDGDALLVAAFAASPEEALARLDASLAAGWDGLLDERRRHDEARLEQLEHAPAGPDGVAPLYRRSLLTLDLLADRATGGIIAAPEHDADFLRCAGYGFVWGRDLAFISLALLAAGRRDLTEGALRWLVRTQSPEGLWLQRHWTDGTLAPCTGLHQVDETGAVLFAFEAAYAELGDDGLDRELWPTARRAAEFLCDFIEPETSLPRATVELWERQRGQHAFTAAAVYGGLRAAASMAGRHEPALEARFRATAEQVRGGIERELWSDEHGRYLRTAWFARLDGDGESVPHHVYESGLPYPNRGARTVDRIDPIVDISLLGLAWPFRAVDPSSPRMQATAAAIERSLVLDDGGVLRFEGDRYAGGNPWLLTTLWLGLWYRQIGDEAGFERCAEYAIARQTETGLLPEQVTRDGRPAWIVPLAWSHAMLILAARPELASIRQSLE